MEVGALLATSALEEPEEEQKKKQGTRRPRRRMLRNGKGTPWRRASGRFAERGLFFWGPTGGGSGAEGRQFEGYDIDGFGHEIVRTESGQTSRMRRVGAA